MSISHHDDAALASLESALDLLSDILQQPPLPSAAEDLAQEVERLRQNQAEAQHALAQATALLRQMLESSSPTG